MTLCSTVVSVFAIISRVSWLWQRIQARAEPKMKADKFIDNSHSDLNLLPCVEFKNSK